MNKKIKVEGNPNLYRDKYSGAIINCNYEEIKLAKIKRAEKQKIVNLEETVDTLKNEMKEIKDLLNNLLQEIKK